MMAGVRLDMLSHALAPEGFTVTRSVVEDGFVFVGPSGFRQTVPDAYDDETFIREVRAAVARDPHMATKANHRGLEIHPVTVV